MPVAARSVSPAGQLDLQDLFDRNHAAWEALDPDKIVALYAADASFWVQGAPRIEGREALRGHFAKLAAQFGRFGWRIVAVGHGRPLRASSRTIRTRCSVRRSPRRSSAAANRRSTTM